MTVLRIYIYIFPLITVLLFTVAPRKWFRSSETQRWTWTACEYAL